MSISELAESLRPILSDSALPGIAEWKKLNPDGKAVGCFPVYTPVELVHAAGMLPVLLAGGRGFMDLQQSGRFVQAFVCSIGRSTPELLAHGFLDQLDMFLFPSICEVSRGLSGIMPRHADGKPVFYLNFPQNIESPRSLDFLICEFNRVKSALEALSGKKISDDSILKSFEIYNKRSDLLSKLDSFRAARPWALPASKFYIFRLAGGSIPPEKHIEILTKAFNMTSKEDESGQTLKMVLTGSFCECPPVELIEALEKAGVSIVADDMLLGQQWWTDPLPLTGDPIKALAEHYLKHAVITSVVHRNNPFAVRDSVRKLVKDRKADGVIIAAAKFCTPALSDSSSIVKACEEDGLPYIKLEFEEGMGVFTPLQLAVDSLLEARAANPTAGTENGRGRK
jgi:benzoyl-CoA reductase subunit C